MILSINIVLCSKELLNLLYPISHCRKQPLQQKWEVLLEDGHREYRNDQSVEFSKSR